jgi:hypothetical protein
MGNVFSAVLDVANAEILMEQARYVVRLEKRIKRNMPVANKFNFPLQLQLLRPVGGPQSAEEADATRETEEDNQAEVQAKMVPAAPRRRPPRYRAAQPFLVLTHAPSPPGCVLAQSETLDQIRKEMDQFKEQQRKDTIALKARTAPSCAAPRSAVGCCADRGPARRICWRPRAATTPA